MTAQLLKLSWVATVVFLAGAAALSARLTANFLAKLLWVDHAEVSTAEVRKEGQVRAEGLSDYRVIESRNLFNAHPKPPAPAEPPKPAPGAATQAQVQTPVVRTPLNMNVIGTVVLDAGRSFALIQFGSELKLVREGDDVAPGAKLAQVRHDRIVVDRGGGTTEEFFLYPPEPDKTAARTRGAPAAAPPRPPPPPGGEASESTDTVRQLAEDKWIVDSRELEDASTNMSKLMTQIRVVPNFTDGQPDGFKIFAIRPGSLFAKIGLQNGDVLKRVNGVEIQGPEQAFEAYQRLKDETSIQIDLVRRNENKTFSYEVR